MAVMASTTYRQGIVFLLLVGMLTIHSEAVPGPVSQVFCRGSPLLANAAVCTGLVNSLQGNSRVIPEGQQSICRALRQGTCCVTWDRSVSGLTENDLYQSASKVLNQCQNNGTVAGYETFDNLNGAIGGEAGTTLCLSNSGNPADC